MPPMDRYFVDRLLYRVAPHWYMRREARRLGRIAAEMAAGFEALNQKMATTFDGAAGEELLKKLKAIDGPMNSR